MARRGPARSGDRHRRDEDPEQRLAALRVRLQEAAQKVRAAEGWAPVTAGGIGVRYPLMRGLLGSRQPAAGTAIRAREPAAAADWT
jgi:hypothetical protein